MWTRFTERARKVVFFSQEEAQKCGHSFVGAEHLLLGLLRDPECTGCRALQATHIDLAALKSDLQAQLPAANRRVSQDMTLSHGAKRVIDLAYHEAIALKHNFIGSEHLMLGIVREAEDPVATVLQKHGADLDKLRTAVADLQ